ncbi:MAG: acylphosphatase [Rhodocyclaceae bacterium]
MSVKHLRIRGRVQGVGYRWAITRQARALGVTGWVRNRYDGSVEAVVAGGEFEVSQLIRWAHDGPSSAQVSHVEIADGSGEFSDFEQRPTA